MTKRIINIRCETAGERGREGEREERALHLPPEPEVVLMVITGLASRSAF